MTCDLCKLIEQPDQIIAQSENAVLMLAPVPAVDGHLVIVPKHHAAIIEQIPDHIVGESFALANKAATALFDAMGAQGTNILLQNGLAAGQQLNHVMINVIPRKQNDGLNLEWQPKQLSEEEMNHLEFTLKEEAKNIGQPKKAPIKPLSLDEGREERKEESSEENKEEKETEDDEENYELSQLRRIP